MVNLASPRLLNLPAWRRNARPAALIRAYTPAKIAITTIVNTIFVQLKMSLVEDLKLNFWDDCVTGEACQGGMLTWQPGCAYSFLFDPLLSVS